MRPKRPEVNRPKEPSSTQPIFGIAYPLMAIGLVFGVAFGHSFINSAPGLAIPIILGLSFLAGIVAPPVYCLVADVFKRRDFRRNMVESGWAKYESDLRTWELIGDEDFGGTTGQELSKIDVQSSPNQFRLSLPSGRRVRRVARYQARVKAAAAARGKRYIEEVIIPAHRALPIVGGWISGSSSVAPEERAEITEQIRPYFERYGLNVTNVLFYWRGMSDGAGGTHEFFDIAVRLA